MLREALGRRGLFKRLGVGALLAASGQDNVARLANVGVGPGSLVDYANPMPSAPKVLRSFKTASDFATWWKEYGRRSAGQMSYVREIDPDIAGFRLPLATKVRMQRDRNYTVYKRRAKQEFLSRLLRFGSVDEHDRSNYPSGAGDAYPSKSLG